MALGFRATTMIFKVIIMPASNELEFIQKIHGKLLNYLEKSKDRFVHPK